MYTYTEFKIIQVGWNYLKKSECWLSWWIFHGNIVALKDGSIFNALCCNLKKVHLDDLICSCYDGSSDM